MNKVNLKIVSAVTLILLWLLISLLISCSNPVSRVLLNDNYYKQVTDKFVLDGGCETDTVFTSDTTVITDTLYSLDFKTDTVVIDDIKTIVKTEYKTVTKTVHIRDTAIVPDKPQIDLLKGQIAERESVISAKEKEIETLKNQLKDWKETARKRGFLFWSLVVSIIVFTFRKPILKIVRKLVLKI